MRFVSVENELVMKKLKISKCALKHDLQIVLRGPAGGQQLCGFRVAKMATHIAYVVILKNHLHNAYGDFCRNIFSFLINLNDSIGIKPVNVLPWGFPHLRPIHPSSFSIALQEFQCINYYCYLLALTCKPTIEDCNIINHITRQRHKPCQNKGSNIIMNRLAKICLSVGIIYVLNSSFAFGMMKDDERPNEHLCPITMDVMKDPVVAADGHSYERKAILQHFQSGAHAKSPLTLLPLPNKDLIDNHALKAMIMDWKPGRQSGPSELDTRDAGSIAERVKKEFRKNAPLLNAATDQHIVAFLGNTGSGKSTLVNLLAGKKLIPSEDGEDYVLADLKDPSAMVIGTTGNSQTLYPKSIDVEGLRFFDLPGFNDTDGSERNLVNAAFTRKILLDAASVRLVFVVGQDQFTADRSASVKNMFQSIKQLFVADHGMSLIDNGVFVATKITCTEQTEITSFLLKKTDARDKEELNQQLRSWSDRKRISRMFHPIRETSNNGVREHILGLIRETEPTKILGLNVSALYPPDTKRPLERMFLKVLEGVFERQLSAPLTTLVDYDKALTFYTSANFWQTFDTAVCREEEAIGLLKEFCINPYMKALRSFEGDNEKKRQTYIQGLKAKKKARVDEIGKRTELRTKNVISSFVPKGAPKGEEDDFVFFDFAYHKDYYDQVCGVSSINQLATDSVEQEIVRQQYAGFIARHSHEQMMRWQQKFSGVSELTKRLALMEEELKKLKAPADERKELIQRPIKVAVPEVARGYEDIYARFLKGVLVYRPTEGSDVGKIELPIAALTNPLESTFDLSQCGDSGKYLSISTGYRKGKKAENASKVEVWVAPRFLIEKELQGTASHFQPIMSSWDGKTAPIGLFYTWGGFNNLVPYRHLTSQDIETVSSEDLYQKYGRTMEHKEYFDFDEDATRTHAMATKPFMFHL